MDYEERVKLCRRIGPLGGRPKGKKNPATLRREAVAEEYRQLVMADARRLFMSQSVLAHGQTFLFRIDKIRIGKDRYTNSEPKLVTKQSEIEAYLLGIAQQANGDIDDETDPSAAYYFITTREPSQSAITDMLNRALGSPRQTIGLEGSQPGSPVEVVHLNDDQYERILRDEAARIAADPAFAVAGVERAAEAPADSAALGPSAPDTV